MATEHRHRLQVDEAGIQRTVDGPEGVEMSMPWWPKTATRPGNCSLA